MAEAKALRGGRFRWWRLSGAAVGLAGLASALILGVTPVSAQPAGSSTSYDGELFALTNQDRTSNGLGALPDNSTLSGIAESSPYYGCSPSPIYGRAADMITRNYFSHQIPGCTADAGYVWPIMSADGIDYRSAGENVGWNSGYADPAAGVNTQFMDSPPHRANILGDYSEMGVGSWYTAGPWNYPGSGGGPYSNVYMFAAEFALVNGAAAAPPVPATPAPAPGGGSSTGGQGSAPTSTATPTPTRASTPAPTPVPTPRPRPKPTAPGIGSRPLAGSQGLLSGTIEQVIGSYLDE